MVGAVVFGAFGLLMLCLSAWQIGDTLKLAVRGHSVVGIVGNYAPQEAGSRKTRRTYHYHYVSAGDDRLRVDLGRQYYAGARVPVVYLPADRNVVAVGTLDDGAFAFLKEQVGFMEIMGFIVGLIGLFVAWDNTSGFRGANRKTRV